ncbi:MAG TPA: EF-P lysine aminoacylase EpmA [Xanthomonadales bacterium]|nr:EF-P lysine aminoacylase EpmA [Xanthomonadales bacterium]
MSDWRPTATRDALALRAGLNTYIRVFLAERGVLEVETPIASRAGNTDPNIESFVAASPSPRANAQPSWLRTSPEFPLKRLLAAGIGDCYELGRVFRHGEAGRRHNPEFTMLEWYRVGWDHVRLMDEVADLVVGALALVGRNLRVERTSYRELFLRFAGVDPFVATNAELHDVVAEFGICTDGLARRDWLDLVLTHRIEPRFAADELRLVHDFPAEQAALARVRAGDPPVAERFEAYLGGFELANGYHELADAEEQRERFARDHHVRNQRHAALPPVDERLLSALTHGLPDCAGVALGVDRLLMAMLGTKSIADVVAFPADRA